MLPIETSLVDVLLPMYPTTPTSGTLLRDAFATPSPKKRTYHSMNASPSCGDEWHGDDINTDWVRVTRLRTDPMVCPATFEPLTEPSTDEIPVEDLLFWLGDAFPTDPAPCQCANCVQTPVVRRPGRGHYLYIPSPRYTGLSAKIPVIALPRIEGLN